MTIENDIDYDALADKIASDDWEPTGPVFDLLDLAEVRAFELLRREYDAAITGAIRLGRHSGATWSAIADAVGLTEADAIAAYRPEIGTEAEDAGAAATPEEPPDVRIITFLVRCRDDAADRLAAAIEAAKVAGVPRLFIETVVRWSDEDARFGWPYPS